MTRCGMIHPLVTVSHLSRVAALRFLCSERPWPVAAQMPAWQCSQLAFYQRGEKIGKLTVVPKNTCSVMVGKVRQKTRRKKWRVYGVPNQADLHGNIC